MDDPHLVMLILWWIEFMLYFVALGITGGDIWSDALRRKPSSRIASSYLSILPVLVPERRAATARSGLNRDCDVVRPFIVQVS